jgi:hypothetical protein
MKMLAEYYGTSLSELTLTAINEFLSDKIEEVEKSFEIAVEA